MVAAISFDHGDGTIDPRRTSSAYYDQIGAYNVSMNWELGDLSGSVDCGTVNVLPDDSPAGFDPADYVGLSLGAAQVEGSLNNLVVRVVRVDEIVYAVTLDYRLDRVNVELDNGIVTKAEIG